MDHFEQLKALKKTKDFFVGIDSDGCAFDTMEIKHKECFIPNIINHWELQAVSKMAREVAEFINLYSQWRGINRFPGLIMTIDMLAERPEAADRGYKPMDLTSLREWVNRETALGNPALEAAAKKTGDAILARTLAWSKAVNADIAKIVRNVPPFPFVRESLEKLRPVADIMCVSATPGEALKREWQEHDLAKYTVVIAGQEMGSKKEHLQHAAAGKYNGDHILMVGDAPGDMKAAQANGALFFPINPGAESESWKRFVDEGIDCFLKGTFRGGYEEHLITEFMNYLPSVPPWKKG
jgi:phosphoglycolate phosphatase-like HAD superfamily hydrolase